MHGSEDGSRAYPAVKQKNGQKLRGFALGGDGRLFAYGQDRAIHLYRLPGRHAAKDKR
jgi:hypothetical protein